MCSVKAWLLSLVLASVSCLRVSDTGLCRWQAGEVGRCLPLAECLESTSGEVAARLQKCQHLHWEGVCCKSIGNKTETFVFDSEQSVYKTYSDWITKTEESEHSSHNLTNKKAANTYNDIIFRGTNGDERNKTKYRHPKASTDENVSRYQFNSQNDSKIRRNSRQLNARQYDGVDETKQTRDESSDDRITYDDGNLNRNRGDGGHANGDTNSYGGDNRQRNNAKDRDSFGDNGYTTERRSSNRRRPSYSTELKPIDDRPVVNSNSDIDDGIGDTKQRTVTSRTVASRRNGADAGEEGSFVFDDGDTRRRGGAGRVPISTRQGNGPEILTGPDDSEATEEQKQSSFDVVKKMCERYSRSVTQQISATPLLPAPQSVTVAVSKCSLDSTPLIVGGDLARHNQFPHMAAVGWPAVQGDSYEWLCGGSLVSEEFVLTAAHCTYQDRDDTVLSGPPRLVHLGANSLDASEAQRIHVQRVYRHPAYRAPQIYHDIALLKLTTSAVLSDSVRPACLGSAPRPGETVVAAGWGLTGFGGTTTRALRTVALRVWDEAGCQEAFGRTRRFPHGTDQSQVCAGDPDGGKDTCQGDSGGPLQVQSRENRCIAHVVGVTSLGRACGLEQSPAVYTRVSHHIHFITQVVWPHM